jgi:hypothetical protein
MQFSYKMVKAVALMFQEERWVIRFSHTQVGRHHIVLYAMIEHKIMLALVIQIQYDVYQTVHYEKHITHFPSLQLLSDSQSRYI